MEQWYANQLKKVERAVYDGMLTCFRQGASSARVPRVSAKTLGDVFTALKLDHPEIFWVKSYRYSYTDTSDYYDLRPEYLFDGNKLKSQQQAVGSRLCKLIRPMQDKTEEEKLLSIHAFLVQNVRYDKLKKEYSHEVFGTLTNGVGVCEGIAKTVKLFCDRLNVPCIVVMCDNDPAQGEKYRHAWNLVKMGGKWLHFDMTFDLTLSKCGMERFDYFALSDEKIARDHRPSMYPVPQAVENGAFRYKKLGLSFTKTEDVEKRLCQILRKKQTQFTFHWRGGYLTREVAAELLQLAGSTARERGLSASASINFAQAVVYLRFSAEAVPVIVEENADEAVDTENLTD